jgi:hypothetical protein
VNLQALHVERLERYAVNNEFAAKGVQDVRVFVLFLFCFRKCAISVLLIHMISERSGGRALTAAWTGRWGYPVSKDSC